VIRRHHRLRRLVGLITGRAVRTVGTPVGRSWRDTSSTFGQRRLSIEALEDRRLLAVYSSNDVPQEIPFDDPISSHLYVPDSLVIQDLNVHVKFGHRRFGDLSFSLQRPGNPPGPEILLFANSDAAGGTDDWSVLVLDDEAPQSITDATAPFDGDYSPEEPLTRYDGLLAQGDWLLRIHDSGEGGGRVRAAAIVAQDER
jgi:subtilisin-like proprotein convertase family protein